MRPPKLSPDSYLRLFSIGSATERGAPPECVTIVRDVGGDVAQIRGELPSGRVVLAVTVDCEFFTEAEINRVIDWVRRAAEGKQGGAALRLAR